MDDTTPQGDSSEPQSSTTATPPQGDTKGPQGQTTTSTTDWHAEAQKWEKRAKADRDNLTELKKQVQTLLTPEQVADQTAAAQAAATEAAKARGEALRLRIALEKGLPADLADRLIGEDRAELEKDADKLAALVSTKAPPTPKSDAAAGTGKQNGSQPQPQDANQLLRMIAGHH